MSDQPDLRKLCIMNAKESDTDEQIRTLCEQYGTVLHFNRPPHNKKLAFPLYKSESEASTAKEGLPAHGYRVEYARPKRSDAHGGTSGANGHARDVYRSRHSLNGIAENGAANFATNGAANDSAISVENGSEPDTTVQPDNRPYGICIKCGEKSYLNCGRCGDFYCSEECQSSDWLVHKRNCFPMPKLVPSQSTFSLCGSRANLATSTESIKTKGIDAADGKQNVIAPATPPRGTNALKSASPLASCPVSTTVESSKIEPVQVERVETAKSSKIEDAQSVRSGSVASLRQKIKLSISDKPSVPFTIPNNSEVMITYAKSHNTVYLRSALKAEDFAALITKVEYAARSAPNLSSYPLRDELVIAPFEGAYYRAMAISSDMKSHDVKVGFIDFGNPAVVQFDTLKVLPEELKALPREIIMVSLKNISPDANQNEMQAMKTHLEELCGNEKVLKITGDQATIGARAEVELFDVISNQSVNQTLNAMVSKHYTMDDIEMNVVRGSGHLLMPIGEDKLSENYITCIENDKIQKFMAEDESVQQYGVASKNEPAYKPKNKELCVVKFKEDGEDIWYRCLYQQELVNDKAQVYCIDYGKILKVKGNDIRAMPSSLMHPMTSIVCYIANDLTMEQKLGYFKNDKFTPKLIEFDGDFHTITLDI